MVFRKFSFEFFQPSVSLVYEIFVFDKCSFKRFQRYPLFCNSDRKFVLLCSQPFYLVMILGQSMKEITCKHTVAEQLEGKFNPLL